MNIVLVTLFINAKHNNSILSRKIEIYLLIERYQSGDSKSSGGIEVGCTE